VNIVSGSDVIPEPVVALRARIVEMRVMHDGETVSYDAAWTATGRRRIATVPVGYADGYRRILSNRGKGILRGKLVPIAGNVTMDMTMFDVTDVPCEIGDVITMLGSDGGESITIADIAALGNLSPYEVLTSLRSRLPRRYFTSGA
jgi:alanine racemase